MRFVFLFLMISTLGFAQKTSISVNVRGVGVEYKFNDHFFMGAAGGLGFGKNHGPLRIASHITVTSGYTQQIAGNRVIGKAGAGLVVATSTRFSEGLNQKTNIPASIGFVEFDLKPVKKWNNFYITVGRQIQFNFHQPPNQYFHYHNLGVRFNLPSAR